MSENKINFIVDVDVGRLDQVIIDFLSDDLEYVNLTRSQLKHWIESGNVAVNDKIILKAGFAVKNGQSISILVPQNTLTELTPIEMPLEIIFEDEYLLAVNKPAGLSVHPGAGTVHVPTLLNGICAYFKGKKLPPRAGIVHRLDKDTTGIVLIAKTVEIQSLLSKMFAERIIKKTYNALVFTTPRARRAVQLSACGEIHTSIGRSVTNWRQMAVVENGGKDAYTIWKRLESYPYATLLEINLKTGRTHQIRVHLDYIHSPIIGDPLYGDTSSLPVHLKKIADDFGRQALHAKRVEFLHPKTRENIVLETELPNDLLNLIEKFRTYEV